MAKVIKWYRQLKKRYGFFGNYVDWKTASEKCRGYGDKIILDKCAEKTKGVMKGDYIYERDGCGFSEPRYEHHILCYLFMAYHEYRMYSPNFPFVVIDWGGALGSIYLQHEKVFDRFFPNMKWVIVEQKNFAEVGQELYRSYSNNVEFIDASTDNLEGQLKIYNPTVILIRGSLQYIDNWECILQFVKGMGALYVIIDRLTVSDRSMICIQKVPESIYSTEYPMHIFTENEVISQMENYDLVERGNSTVDSPEWIYDKKIEYKMLCFKRKHKLKKHLTERQK